MIYFIQVEGAPERVKVGKAHNVERRMYELSRYPSSAWQDTADYAGGSKRLVLRAACEGYSETEAALHRMLAPHHLYGEWFDATAPIVHDLMHFASRGGAQALEGLVPDAQRADRVKACPHTMTRMPDGTCLLCDAENNPPLVSVVSMPVLDAGVQQVDGFNPSAVRQALAGSDEARRFVSGTPPVVTNASSTGILSPETPMPATSTGGSYPDPLQARLMSALGGTTGDVIDHDAADAAAIVAEFEEYKRKAEGEWARRDLAEFFRQAVAAGEVKGLHKLQPSPHIDATCMHVQMILEGWLVTQGWHHDEHGERDYRYASDEMIAKQRNAWVIAYGSIEAVIAATGDDEPWLREPLVQNMIENICPGTLKSTIAMVVANAWVWLHAPHVQFGASSWNEKNVKRDSNATKDLVKSAWYRTTFEITWIVRGDQDAVELWTNSAGGFRLSSAIRTGFTGQHVHMMFVDDPDDADGVWQEANRETRASKWSNAMENRVVDEITCIRFVLQQRVHHADHTGYLLAQKRWSIADRKGWAWLVIPLRYGRGPKDAPRVTPYGWSDWRTDKDEVMHPARFTLAVIADKFKTLLEFGFAAQYDQNPQIENGGMFDRAKANWWRFEDEDPARMTKRPLGSRDRTELPALVLKRDRYGRPAGLDDILISVDATFGSVKKTASNVGLTVLGKWQERKLWLDDRSRVMGVQEQYDAILECVCEWAPCARVIIIELKALGEAVVNELAKALASGEYNGRKLRCLDGTSPRIVVDGITVGAEAGKIVRARGAAPDWNAGLVYMHDGAAWVYPQLDDQGKVLDDGAFNEVVMFPNGRKMDRVDTFSQAVGYWRDNGADEQRARALNTL